MILYAYTVHITYRYVRKRSHDEATPTDDITATPPPKKKKHGQHKHRPPLKIPFSTQLCPSLHIHSGNQCSFGNKCRYIHDIAKYLDEKPVDIGEHCYIFETYGFCPSGLACRFGRSHISSEHVNTQRDESQPSSQLNSVYNVIPRYLQEQLRKRRLKFPRSNAYMKQLKNNQPSDNSEVKRGVDLVTPERQDEIVDKIERPVLDPEISDSEKVSEPVVTEGSTTDALVTGLEGEHKRSSENIINEACPEYDNTSGNKKLFDEEIIVRGNESGRTSLSDSKSGEDVSAVKDLCVDVMNVSSNEDRSEDRCSVNNEVVDADTKVTGNPHVHPSENPRAHTSGSLTDEDLVKLKPLEKKKVHSLCCSLYYI